MTELSSSTADLARQAAHGDPVDLLAPDAALADLDEFNPRHCRVVELRYFGGLTHQQAATVLGISEETSQLDWSMARAWLTQRLKRDAE